MGTHATLALIRGLCLIDKEKPDQVRHDGVGRGVLLSRA